MAKKQSSCKQEEFTFYKIDTVESMIPIRIKKAKELICLDDDATLQILRYFKWNNTVI